MELQDLQELLDTGEFHHATYRNFGTVWEDLWIYTKEENGFRGFAPAGCFSKASPDFKKAEEMVKGTGVSVGSYGNG